MTTRLYWFSGTGNSLSVARHLAAQLEPVELVSITHSDPAAQPPAEVVGLIFPVYFFGPAPIVVDYLEKLPLNPQAYIFSVATSGGSPGGAHHRIRKILRRRGAELAAGWSLTYFSNYPRLFASPPEEKQQRIIRKAEQRIPALAEAIRQRKPARLHDSLWPIPAVAGFMWNYCARRIQTEDEHFSVTEACISCGLCARLCPTKDIEMRNGRPHWLGRCQQCMACFQWCPVRAILAGGKADRRTRYHHPEIHATDLLPVLQRERP